nr:uncharacterized protein LOC112273875 isoform X3 [Physcomitrium patens]|eukprot:XP_024358663.1 uncharacterized protein LOC112273875 isoform X3 [Physcomitrella patens]
MAMFRATLAPGLQVSKLCLGTMTYGEQNTFEDACQQLNMATEEGVNFLDAAEMYPVPQRAETQGRTEEYVGRWLKQSQVPRDRVVLATKATGPSGQMTWIRGGPSSLDGRNIKEAIDGSLKRLGTDYIDLYQLHWPDRYVPMFGDRDYDPSCSYSSVSIEEQLQALGVAVKEGKKHWCEQRNSVWGDGILPSGRTEQLTSSDYYHPGRYAEAECRYSMAKPNVLPAIKAYVEIAQRHNLSPVALAIGFVLKRPLVTSVVIGATKLWQLREILDAARVHLSEDILAEIDRVHERYPNPTP